ncbi:MAG: cytochrome c oxidase assembly protein [Methylomonas sp.]|jgi:cytochrome c oxidase assembly protein subunit 11|uniref:cytochrome c oxidase assembly protein n=1 Tax=Methylomonas sp. TaxID=418 RepID=UPI0025F6E4AC|nr:cytochrome c oxidase assembly protein [Methylomonas sp.]MCK9606478.1 cytochrome c oxidase assembly protein [Methylomonas sp.]
MSDELRQKNTKLVKKLVIVALLMFGFGYALVPIYDVLCSITGQNAKLEESVETEQSFVVDENRVVNVEFITSVNESTPLDFHVETRSMKVHPGQYYTVNFYAKNNLPQQIKVQAIPSITPGLAEEFFKKVQCFCFELQTFEANEEKSMPVRFVVNPMLPERYKTITLSYTFFDRTNNTEN